MTQTVLFVTPWSYPDLNGVSDVVTSHCELCQKAGFAYHVISGSSGLNNDRYTYLGSHSQYLPRLARSELLLIVNQINPTCIILHTVQSWVVSAMLPIINKSTSIPKVIIWSHGTTLFTYFKQKPCLIAWKAFTLSRDALYLLRYRNLLTAYVCLYSRPLRFIDDRSMDAALLGASRIVRYFANLPHESVQYLRKRPQSQLSRFANQSITILLVGPPTPEKGFNDLQSTVDGLLNVRVNVTLIILIPSVTWLPKAETIVRSTNIPPDVKIEVRIASSRAAVVEHLSRSDIYLSLSLSECQSLVYVDAFCLGLVIVARNSGFHLWNREVSSCIGFSSRKELRSSLTAACDMVLSGKNESACSFENPDEALRNFSSLINTRAPLCLER